MIKYLENENLEDLVSNGVYIVDFYADWCGPCKMMGSVLEKMEDANIIKVNTDAHQDLAISYGIMSIPTLIFFKDGKEVKKEIGFKDEATIRETLKNIEN
jgi:thioredoxin 1